MRPHLKCMHQHVAAFKKHVSFCLVSRVPEAPLPTHATYPSPHHHHHRAMSDSAGAAKRRRDRRLRAWHRHVRTTVAGGGPQPRSVTWLPGDSSHLVGSAIVGRLVCRNHRWSDPPLPSQDEPCPEGGGGGEEEEGTVLFFSLGEKEEEEEEEKEISRTCGRARHRQRQWHAPGWFSVFPFLRWQALAARHHCRYGPG